MAQIINTLADAISYINTLYEGDSSAPSDGDEDFEVWNAYINIAINIWEKEEGVLWRELFVKLDDASDGDKTAAGDDYSYDCPSNFVFPAVGYVWIGDGTTKTAYKVITQEEFQLRENNTENWCYFTKGGSPTLEFNPNCTVVDGTIRYNYYKQASSVSATTDTFDMSDPMFVVYYSLGELKKDEGDTTGFAIATQKLEAMKISNVMPSWFQEDSLINPTEVGFNQ